MDTLQVADMTTRLRNRERVVRLGTSQGTDVFYQVRNEGNQFTAIWEIDVQLGNSDRKELCRLKAFSTHSDAVDYLVTHRDDPLKHEQLLREV